mgnify:CR=1 FL=1
MEKLFNAEYRRWEVYPEEPLVHNGEEMPVFVSESEEACDAYMMRLNKPAQYQTILRLIEKDGCVTRRSAFRAGVAELPARICEMIQEGIPIVKAWEKEYYPDGKYKGKHRVYSI